jgi:ketosteroid isomerase-like protein
MNSIRRWSAQCIFLLTVMMYGSFANASDVDDLTAMLHDFLAGASVGDVAAHEKFWSDDLIYTSSSGSRTNKAAIVEGMQQAASEDDGGDSGPGVVYTGEDVQVNVYGSTAVVAFRLVGTPQGESEEPVANYFNTGTFLKQGGSWKVIAWQATRIPDAE